MNEEILREVLERITRIETKIDNYKSYMEMTNQAHNIAKSNQHRIKTLENNITWLQRTVAGAIITGIISFGIVFMLNS